MKMQVYQQPKFSTGYLTSDLNQSITGSHQFNGSISNIAVSILLILANSQTAYASLDTKQQNDVATDQVVMFCIISSFALLVLRTLGTKFPI